MVTLTLKTISHCLLDLEKNWNIQIKYLKNNLSNAQNEIARLKRQLDAKEKLLKSYEERATEALSLNHSPPQNVIEHLPQNAFQPIIMVPQNGGTTDGRSRSVSPQMVIIEDVGVKAEQTMEIKREAAEVIDVMSVDSASPSQQVILVQAATSPVPETESMTIAPVEAPLSTECQEGAPEALAGPLNSKSTKRRRIEYDDSDEVPLDVVLRESNQEKQKQARVKKSTGNTTRRNTIGPESYRPLVPKGQPGRIPNRGRETDQQDRLMLDLKCPVCSARCKDLDQYHGHIFEAHPKSKLQLCKLCPYATVNKMNHDHHIRNHNEYVGHPDAIRCRGGCNMYFINPRLHTAHLHKYHYQSLTNIEQQLSQ